MQKQFKVFSFLTLLLVLMLGDLSDLQAAGKRRNADAANISVSRPKPVVEVYDIENHIIEVPSLDTGAAGNLNYTYGKNISARLVSDLVENKRMIVVTPLSGDKSIASSSAALLSTNPSPVHIIDPPYSSLRVKAKVNELSFQAGARAERTYYGFYPERPEQANDFQGVVSRVFGDTGRLHDGVELGDEINLSVLLAGLLLKYARFKAAIGLELFFENLLTNEIERKSIRVVQKGFYFDLAGQYQNYSGAITVARRAALVRSFEKVVAGLSAQVMSFIQDRSIDLLSKIHVTDQGFFTGVGTRDYNVQAGQIFCNLSARDRHQGVHFLKAQEVYESSSHLVPLDESVASPDIHHEGDMLASSPVACSELNKNSSQVAKSNIIDAASTQEIQLPETKIPLPNQLQVPLIQRWIGSLKLLVMWPYLLYRFLNYDRGIKGHDQFQANVERLKVAILDTGIDYNHKALRKYFVAEQPGFDFYSVDSRPFDDHAHGTQVAGALVKQWESLNQQSSANSEIGLQLFSFKVLSPWGHTQTAAISAALQKAVDLGVQVVIIPWATFQRSTAMLQGLKNLVAQGVLVFAAAGDEGQEISQQNPWYPAAYLSEDATLNRGLVVVGASNKNGLRLVNSGPLHLSSNFGSIISVYENGDAADEAFPSPRNRYRNDSHSGLATAKVAGAALWALAKCKKNGISSDFLTQILKNNSIQNSTIPLFSLVNFKSAILNRCN